MITMEPLIEMLAMRENVNHEDLVNVLRMTPRVSHLWSSNEVSPSLLCFTMSLGHWITFLGLWRFHRIQMSTLPKRRGFN